MPATAPLRSDAGRRDVTRFLAAHEHCETGFEVMRDSGPRGGLRLHCSGCGESVSYAVGELGGGAAAARVPPARARRGSSGGELERWLPAPAALPSWVPNAYILALIAIGLAMVAFGLLSASREPDAVVLGGEQPANPAPSSAGAPAPGAGNASGENSSGPAAGGSGTAARAVPAPAKGGRAAGSDRGGASAGGLDRVVVFGRFSIGVPDGWSRGLSSGAIVLRPPTGEQAELRVFLEPGDGGPRRLAREAAGFLKAEHRGAKLSRARPVEIGGDPAVLIAASYKGGRELAALLSEAGYEYLLLRRVDEGAGRRVRTQAAAALKSFRAL